MLQVKDLTSEHIELAEHMGIVGRELLAANAAAADRTTTEASFLLLYHVPPFNSIDHLHVHCFELPFKSWGHSKKYALSSHWCASHDEIVADLKANATAAAAAADTAAADTAATSSKL
jgi:sulfate adenylyltransferase (ADP) / adenylylsulfatase